MEKLLLGTRPMIYTRFIDLDDQKTLYDNFTPDSPSALYEHTFSFGTRQYRLETAPTPAYFMQHHGWQSWSVLAAGILGTGLLGALLLLGTGYTVRITAQVEDRTRKLKESESRFRNILRNAPIGMATTDLHGQFIQINHAICAILGYEKDELEKLTLKDITHPDDVPQSLAYRHQLWHGKINSYRMEKRYLRKDGQVVWTLLAESIERDDVGTPLYFISQIEDISERKQVEQSLREAEARFRSSFEAAAIGMALVSIEGGFVDVNPALCQIVGYSHDELTRKTFQEITHPDDLELDLDYAQELILGKRASYQLEKRYYHKDGHIVWIQLTGSTVRDAQGKLLYFIAQIQDITESRQTAEALRKSLEEVRDMYNRAPCGYHSLNKEGVIERINDTELEWLGYQRDEVVGKMKLSDLITPASLLDFQQTFPLVKTRGFLKDFGIDLVRKDGTILNALVNASVIYDADGEYLTSRSTLFDVTERKKAEDTLRALFIALEHSPIAVIVTDADTNIQYVSPRFSEISGYASADVIGRNLRILQSERISNYVYLEMWNNLTSGQSWHGELLSKNKQGRTYWEEVHITPVKTPAGSVVNYVVVSSDITERKAVEEKMRHLANFDPLTDMPNRSLIDDRLQQALAAAKREKATMALMFLDLDKFKPINDTLGHDIGDMVLKEAARRMQDCVRESDMVGRIGGDEFVVLLPTIDSEQHAVLVAEKIRYTLNQPFVLAGQELHISSSIGVAIYPGYCDDGKTLVKNADAAMYHAKAAGRNNVQVFKPEMLASGEYGKVD